MNTILQREKVVFIMPAQRISPLPPQYVGSSLRACGPQHRNPRGRPFIWGSTQLLDTGWDPPQKHCCGEDEVGEQILQNFNGRWDKCGRSVHQHPMEVLWISRTFCTGTPTKGQEMPARLENFLRLERLKCESPLDLSLAKLTYFFWLQILR